MGKATKPRASKKEMENKRQLAYRLYMAGEEQKAIAESISVSEKTIGAWAAEEKWKQKRSAASITRDELVNKILTNINNMLDKSIESDDANYKTLGDDLIKMANTIEKLDKNNVVNDIQTFMRFNNYLMQSSNHNESITPDVMKTINRLQNAYVTSRMDA
jgi:Putative ATPase subunit of terminase (gpP-like)